ncbi:Ankyrin-2 like protein [Verticillium longisporum]|nr:Ankyrin-2 like protein [Verticillium longisporum]
MGPSTLTRPQSEPVDPPQYELLSEPANPRPGGNLLHIAIKNGSGVIAHTLVVGGGADVDAREVANGDRPLHCAVRARSISMSRMLLHHGARLDLRNDAGLTPLDLAVRLQEEDIVELLIEGGARVL